MKRRRALAGALILGSALSMLAATSVPRSLPGRNRAGSAAPLHLAEADRVAAYRKAERDWETRARGNVGIIAIGTALFGLMHFALENVVLGPDLSSSGRHSLQSLAKVRDALVALSANDGLMIVLMIFTAEAALAIALATTKVDPQATPHVVVETERWLGVLRGSVHCLAASACLVTLGAVVDTFQRRVLPPGAVLILILAMITCMLAMAMVDRSYAVTGQLGILSQLDRTAVSDTRLAAVEPGTQLSLLRLSVIPVAVVLTGGVVTALVTDGPIQAALRGGASLVLLGWLLFTLAWARHGLIGSALTWSDGRRHGGARMMAVGMTTIGIVSLTWGMLSFLMAMALAPAHPWVVVGLTGLLLLPVLLLAVDGAPRIRRRPVRVSGAILRVAPSPAITTGAQKRLGQRRQRLNADLDEWTRRSQAGPLLPDVGLLGNTK